MLQGLAGIDGKNCLDRSPKPSRFRDFIILRVLGLNDTPHRIALGAAIAVFVAWTPTIPFQMALTLILAVALGANKIVGQPIVWITNPFTAIPIYWLNFVVGCKLVQTECSTRSFLNAIRQVINNSETFAHMIQLSWRASLEFFWPLWVGSVFLGLLLGGAVYFLCLRAVVLYRSRHDRAG